VIEKGHKRGLLLCGCSQLSMGNALRRKENADEKESGGPTPERWSAMRVARSCESALLVGTWDGIRLLGGAARIWDRCLAAGWIRPAVRAGRIHYYRYGDIAVLAERLCRERPPRVITVGMKEVE
jgi:hypothetical protein